MKPAVKLIFLSVCGFEPIWTEITAMINRYILLNESVTSKDVFSIAVLNNESIPGIQWQNKPWIKLKSNLYFIFYLFICKTSGIGVGT